MATETVTLRVDTKQAISSLNGLKEAVAGVVTALAVGTLTRFADEVTKVNNRLRVLTPSVEAVNAQFNALAAIAIETRTPLESVNDLYFRIARSADQLGISQQEAASITESLAKALTASGQTAGEAAGPLLQLGQALQSGRFQGDELRSILEGLQPVAVALAKELGVPVGALKELGSQGKITADVFVRAMQRNKEAIDAAFAATKPTISGAMTNLKTSLQVAFNEVDKQTGVSNRFALIIEYMGFQVYKASKNIGEIIEPLRQFIRILGAIAVFIGVIRVFNLLRATAIGIAGAFRTLGKLWDEISIRLYALSYSTVGVSATFQKFWMYTKALIKPIWELAKGIVAVGGAIAAYFGLDKAIDAFTKFTDKGGDAEEQLKAYREELAKMQEGLPTEAGTAAPPVDLGASEKLQTRLDNLRDKIREVAVDFEKYSESLASVNQQEQDNIGLSENQIQLNETLNDVRNTAADSIREYVSIFEKLKPDEQALKEEILDQIKAILARSAANEEATEKRITALQQEAQRIRDVTRELELKTQAEQEAFELDKIAQQIVLLELYGDEAERTRIILEATNELRSKLLQYGEKERQLIEDKIKLGDEEFKKQMEHLEKLRIKAYEVANAKVEAETAVIEKQKELNEGWQQALGKELRALAESVTPAKTAADLFGSAIDNIDQALTDFVQKGKFSFKDFATSILKDMAVIIARALVMRAILAMVGAISPSAGAALSSYLGIQGKAGGGPVSATNPYIVGERGPELFVPRAAGTIIPNNQLAMAGGGANVTYNINAVDASSFRSLVARDPQFIYSVTEVGRRSSPSRRLAG